MGHKGGFWVLKMCVFIWTEVASVKVYSAVSLRFYIIPELKVNRKSKSHHKIHPGPQCLWEKGLFNLKISAS